MSATDFWQENQVAGRYETYVESVDALLKRAHQFPLLNELMPTQPRAPTGSEDRAAREGEGT